MKKEEDFMKTDFIEFAKSYILEAKKIVVLTGAGISTESGVPDFASLPDYYDEKEDMTYSRKDVMSKWFFYQKPADFYAYMEKHLSHEGVEPNDGHYFLAELEQRHDVTIVTQNIDGLHEKAGSTKVIPYHGSLDKFYCFDCNKTDSFKGAFQNEKGHYQHRAADQTVHTIVPDVVLYGEPIAPINDVRAIKAFEEADLILVMGTSLEVYPAAGLVTDVKNKLTSKFFINKTLPPNPEIFHHVFETTIGDFVSSIPIDETGRILIGETAAKRALVSASRYRYGDIVERKDFVFDEEECGKIPDGDWRVHNVILNETYEDNPLSYCLTNTDAAGSSILILHDCDFI